VGGQLVRFTRRVVRAFTLLLLGGAGCSRVPTSSEPWPAILGNLQLTRTMERLPRPEMDYLIEVAWAVFMLDLIFLLLGLLFVRHLGIVPTAWLIGVLMAATTLFLGGTAVANVLAVSALDRIRRRREQRRGRGG
jgi:hypothetical protein